MASTDTTAERKNNGTLPTSTAASDTFKTRILPVAIVLIVVVGAIVAGVCGSGNCSSSSGASSSTARTVPDADEPTKMTEPPKTAEELARAALVTEFINNITFSGRVIDPTILSTLVFDPEDPPRLEEERALEWLIEKDNMTLVPDTALNQFHMQQRYALHTIMGGGDGDECNWDGVSCNATATLSDDTQVAVVTKVEVQRPFFLGFLSPDLGLLSEIVTFAIPTLSLLGPIPESLSRWTNLQHFDVSVNNLNGTFPTSVAESWTNLMLFNIDSNTMTGTLPMSSLAKWTNLETFIVRSAPVSFSLVDIGMQWPNLRVFDVAWSGLFNEGGALPSSIGQWTNLVTFDTQNIRLTGTLPPSIGNWTDLKYFSVPGNALTGSLPESIGSWTGLTHFVANDNLLTGSLPPSFSNWTNLESFNVAFTDIAVPFADIGAHWPKLKTFNVGSITSATEADALPSSIGQWTNLQFFSVDLVGLTGSLPPSIGNWTDLEYFYVGNNLLTGSLPESIGSWTDVTYLVVSDNLLTGSLPQSMSNLTKLEYARFERNNFVGTVPTDLCDAAANLSTLCLEETQVNCADSCCMC